MTAFFCRSLQASIVLKRGKKNIQVLISDAVTFSGKSHPIISVGEMTRCLRWAQSHKRHLIVIWFFTWAIPRWWFWTPSSSRWMRRLGGNLRRSPPTRPRPPVPLSHPRTGLRLQGGGKEGRDGWVSVGGTPPPHPSPQTRDGWHRWATRKRKKKPNCKIET